jgi:DNA-binding transcriptional ArsR family regulator
VPRGNGAGIELLADPTRRRIVAALALQQRRPSSLAAEFGLSRPAIARQLHILRDAGFIRSGRSMVDRCAILFALEPRRHGVITAWLAGTEIGRPKARFGRSGEPQPILELIEWDAASSASEAPEEDRSA